MTTLSKVDRSLADALREEGGGYGPGRTGLPTAPPRLVPREPRDGEIKLGIATNSADAICVSLSKLIEGRLLIQGSSGAGKSMLLRRLFEQSFGRVQQLLIDVDGEFSTLAEKFDVAVITSAEALRVGGAALGKHLREHRYSAILDLSDATAEDRYALVADLFSAIVDASSEFWNPMLVLIDEAQSLVPRYDPGDVEQDTRKRTIRALADAMSRGRKRGVAGVIATSRIAETSTPVIAKCTNVIVGRTIFDRDLERAGDALGFTAGHSRALRSLSDGEFVGIGPAFNIPGRSRFKAGTVQSKHKGETPQLQAPPALTAGAAMALLGSLAAEPMREQPAIRIGGGHRTGGGRRGRDWSQEEDQIIRDGYGEGLPIAEIGKALAEIGFSTSTSNISTRAHALGLVSAKAAAGWSGREDEILRDAYAREVRIMDIVGLLSDAGFYRGRVAIQMRAIGLGITRDRVNYWTEPEKAIAISGLTGGKPYREIIADLKAAGYERGLTGILKFAQKNNFHRGGDAWTEEDIAQLKKLYEQKVPPKDIAERLGKKLAAVRSKASNLGLKQRLAWTDAEYQALTKAFQDGKTLTDAVAIINRPYANVARVAVSIGLRFMIPPDQRKKSQQSSKGLAKTKRSRR